MLFEVARLLVRFVAVSALVRTLVLHDVQVLLKCGARVLILQQTYSQRTNIYIYFFGATVATQKVTNVTVDLAS